MVVGVFGVFDVDAVMTGEGFEEGRRCYAGSACPGRGLPTPASKLAGDPGLREGGGWIWRLRGQDWLRSGSRFGVLP